MENTRIVSFLLLLLTITIGGARAGNFFINIEPKWDYILQAVDSLEMAKEIPDLEAKHFYIQEAIEIYQEGPNLLGLQMLSRQNSSVEIDYLLPKVITGAEEERIAAINSVTFAPKSSALSVLTGVLIITTFLGAIAKENYSYSKWSTKNQHFYIAIIAASFLALFVGFLP